MDFKRIGLPLAIIVAIIIMLIPLPGLSYAGHMALALLVFAIIMWVSEALHLAATSIIILFMQPILGIATFQNVAIGFANPILFLMIGGFIIAEGIRKSGLVE
ncbi:anion permease, partial [Methanobrevibacter sp. TMH8]|uniref:SLC13 family permease n=1 Tax=Methanobrevibacter sp. TMH8 TaxID=2848611 RepID=UPI001CCAE6E3